MDHTIADRLVGKTLAQYEIVARIGGGGMGVVYAARDTKLGRRVALKFLPSQWCHDDDAKQRFIREAQAASAVDHPSICTVHDIGTTDDGQLFIVMAHYTGETLKQRLERGPLAVHEAVDIAAQLAEGLATAHAAGVIHRDVKPGNIMLTEGGVKILDFGLAKFADTRLQLTLEGSTVGTIAYMSPEQVRGEEADPRSDMWAAGAVLYEMLAGAVPFKGGYPEAIAHAIKHDLPAPLRTARAEVSEALEQIVFRALHKEPGVRFPSARELARALRQLQGRTLPLDLRTEPLRHVPPVMPPRPVRAPGRLRWVVAAAVALAVMVAMKTGRIDRNGKIVNADTSISVTKDPGKGGPDQVQWVALNNGTYTIRFARSPFLQHAGAEEIPVSPLSEPRTVAAPNGKYKYSVHDANGQETDDPDVIIV